MKPDPVPGSTRILIVDDNPSIHDDFRKILGQAGESDPEFDEMEAALFGGKREESVQCHFLIDSAYQGQEALDMVRRSVEEDRPYSMAFVDVRMPPGWDGIETLERVWQIYPELQAVICTAHTDYSWEDVTRRLGHADDFLILKKPFETVEVLQMAHALTHKWSLAWKARLRMEDLEQMVRRRTQELLRANRHLEEEIEERERVQNALRQAQKMESVGLLAAGVAHEFNNILTVIKGNINLLQINGTRPEDATDAYIEVLEANDRAATLTSQLLAFSRKRVLQPRQLDLSAVVRSCENMLGKLLGENFNLEIDCEEGTPAVHADRNSLIQVLMNLVANSRDATPGGGTIRIRISSIDFDEDAAAALPEARCGRFVVLSVIDSGSGMEPDVLCRIFDPFFTTKEPGSGTGLGLSMTLGIVKQQNGWIDVQSDSRGTVFTIYLPVSPHDEAPAPVEDRAEAETSDFPRGDGEVVLIVEDEPRLLELTCTMLRQYGYEVFCCENGREALETWGTDQGRLDLLLTDVVMPGGVSGDELARHLLSVRPGLKVICASGYSPESLTQEVCESLSACFLQKPYTFDELLRLIHTCLAPRQVAEPASP